MSKLKVAPTVLGLDGPDVITGTGSIVAAPDPAAPDVILDRLAAALGHNGQVLLTDREPSWESIVTGKHIGVWTISGGPSWYTAEHNNFCLRIGILRDIRGLNDPLLDANPIPTVIRHQIFARLVGVPFFGDGGTTCNLLLDATVRVRGRAPLRKWRSGDAPAVQEDAWPGGGVWHSTWPGPEPERPLGSTITVDCNAQYLWGACACYLALDGLTHTRARWDPALAGYWLLEMPANPEPRLPHPAGYAVMPGEQRWVTTPTAALLAELAGGQLDVADAWTCPRDRCRRVLDPWYQTLRNARAALLNDTDADSLAIRQAVKDCYSRGISHLDRRSERQWYRPDWKATLFANARVSMWRALRNAGTAYNVWPVAVQTDAAEYAELDAPQAFKIGAGMGQWKVEH